MLGTKKAVTGSSDGCMKIWTIETCDIVSELMFRNAHAYSINDISTKPDSDSGEKPFNRFIKYQSNSTSMGNRIKHKF